MHDHFNELFEWGKDGKLRRKRFARDRDRISFPMTMMDHAAYGFSSTFSDGSPDHTSPHRPGYRFADVNDEARIAAERAYEQRSIRMADAWRHKGAPQDADADERTPARTRSTDELQQAADQAYRDRSYRLANAWRNRDA